MLFCPCGLLRNEVIDLDQRDRVILREGSCQNLLANGGEGVCGQPLGAHPLAQGNSILINLSTNQSINQSSYYSYILLLYYYCIHYCLYKK
jgi:hypothetical protein